MPAATETSSSSGSVLTDVLERLKQLLGTTSETFTTYNPCVHIYIYIYIHKFIHIYIETFMKE